LGGEKLKLSRLVFFASLFFIFLCFAGGVIPLSAQTAESEEEDAQSSAPLESQLPLDESAIILGETIPGAETNDLSSVFLFFFMVLVLALAALAIYGVVFFIKRISRPQEGRDPNLKILARVPLGNDAFTALISVGAKVWLVGGGSNGVNLISEIDDTESIETLLLEDAKKSEETGIRRYFNFTSLLKRRPAVREDLPGSSQAEDLRKQRERLRGL
jgi:flagellar protein FliO/FliZ